MLLYTNIQHDTNSVIPIASLLKDLLNGSKVLLVTLLIDSVGIDMFLDNHGLDFICDEIDCIKRVETVLALYDLMIVVFREGRFYLSFFLFLFSFSKSITFFLY